MATANLTAVWQDSTYAYAAASVTGDDPSGNVEYLAKTPLRDGNGNLLPLATLKANLIAALQAVRHQQLAGKTPLGITGTVTL